MQDNKDVIEFKVGEFLPDFVCSDSSTQFSILWVNDSMHIFICDCQNDKEAAIFSKANIQLSLSKVKDIIFFIVEIPELSLSADIPYNVVMTPHSMEDVKKGFDKIYIVFCSTNKLIKSMRGITLMERTKDKITDYFIEEKENLTSDKDEYMKLVDDVYRKYPTPASLKERQIMYIKWRDRKEFS